MQYCEGDNLEFYLRNKETYEKGKNIINTLLKYIIENKIYWYGFAARNILVGKNTIYFVDFEKGIGNMDTDIQSFLQHNVYEEYSIFLLKKDRIYTLNDVLSVKDNYNIKVSDIKYKRYKALTIKLGYTDFISKEDYLNVLKLLLEVEEPRLIDGNFYFPSIPLYRIYKEKGMDAYCDEIIEIYNKFHKL